MLFTRNEIAQKPSTPAIGKAVNALNLVLKALPMFSKSTLPHLLTQHQCKYLLYNPPLLKPSLQLGKREFATNCLKKFSLLGISERFKRVNRLTGLRHVNRFF